MEETVGFMVLVIFIFIFFSLASGIFIVRQQQSDIIERFGKYHRLAGPGIHFKIPIIDRVAARMNLKVQQLDVSVETKSKDNVFVNMITAVQFKVMPEKVYEAFYQLDDPYNQIESYVFDVVRAEVPKIILDDVFEKKDMIAKAVNAELSQTMEEFGFNIIKSLITDIQPDAGVKAAMNEINAAQRDRVAAEEKGEANKILKVKDAEADAESKRLSGKGIADQRTAIIEGLRESVENFQTAVQDSSSQEVMTLVLLTQYFDTLKDISASSVTNTILMPHSPGAMKDIESQMRDAIIVGNKVDSVSKEAVK